MKIKSNFKDYYDCILRYANLNADDSYIFVRNTSTLTLPVHCSDFLQRDIIHPGIVCFCGKIYPFVSFHADFSSYGKKPTYKNETFYNYEDLIKKYEINALSERIVSPYHYISGERKNEIVREWLTGEQTKGKKPFLNFVGHKSFDRKNVEKNYITPLFKEYAYFSIESGHQNTHGKTIVDIYPNLKMLQFQRVKSPEICFQELEMFLSNNILSKNKEIWQVPDRIKAESHGFDKYSFRKDKS